MDLNQQIVVALLIGAIAYYYFENEKTSTSSKSGTKTTGELTDNNDGTKLNEVKGFLPHGGTFLVGSAQLPAVSLQECYDLAVEKDAFAYTYRNDKHDQESLKNTCGLLSNAGTGEITGTDAHLSGCTDTNQDYTKGCLNYAAEYRNEGTSLEG